MRLLSVSEKTHTRAASLPFIAAAILTAGLCQSLFGQTFTSSITGNVTDPTGAAVVGAKVELQNMATHDVRDDVTHENGSYQFSNLNPGTYQITVTAPGFKTYVQQNLTLEAQIASTVNISLELGGTEQKVEVTAAATLVDTETANNVTTMETRLIENLPNATRNPLNFVYSLAGTTAPPGGMSGRFATTSDQNTSAFGLNGGRSGEESILIDGAPAQALDWGGLFVAPLQDSVQEQQVVVNTYDSQYVRAGAGIVTLITKGGTNQFHGEGYEYNENAIFNANSWTNNRYGTPIGDYNQNQFGGNFSGPLLKRANLFFFGAYEGFRNPFSTSSGLLNVPTQAERNGDFSQSRMVDPNNPSQTIPVTIFNPFSTTQVGTDANGNPIYTRTQFTNNQIPSNLINAVGQKIANLYPLPNRSPLIPGTDIGNFLANGTGNNLSDKMDTRIDWAQSSTNRMFFRFSDRFRQGNSNPCFFCNGADSSINYVSSGWLAVLNDTVTPSPTWVINSFISYGYWREGQDVVGFGQLTAADLGLNAAMFQAPTLPYINVTNGDYTNLGQSQDSADVHYARTSSSAQINVTKELAKHSIKFGGNFDVQQISNFKDIPGEFDFNTALTSCDPQAGGPCQPVSANGGGQSNLTGNAIAEMLLGTPSGGSANFGISPAMTIKIFGGYIQDQWRVTPKLTINAGLRYENQRPATERHNQIAYFDPNAVNPISQAVAPLLGRPVMGQFEFASSDNRYAWPPDNTNFAPRMGIAYKVTDKLVVRAGAGIFYLPASAMLSFDTPGGQFVGFGALTGMAATQTNGVIPLNTLSNPYPNGVNTSVGPTTGGLTAVGDSPSQIWIKEPHPTPYSEQWSFDIQYQLGAHSVFEIGYSGNRGKKLLYGNPNINIDQLPDQYLSLGEATLNEQVPNPFYNQPGVDPNGLGQYPTVQLNQLLRPFPQYGYLGVTRSLPGAHSAFDALNLKYNHTFSAGLSLLVTYQWSKALDNGPEDFLGWATGNQWRDSYNTNLDYAISTHDIPQSFATALVYDLPYGKGKHWGNDAPALVRGVLGNWQLATSIRLASGLPIPYSISTGETSPLAQYGFPDGTQLPDLVKAPRTTGNPDAWIDPSSFVIPSNPGLTLGNIALRYTQLRERAERNVDLSIAKDFPITERFRVKFQGQAFNLFNYAQYNSIDTCLDCGTFGQAYGTENQPRILQLGVKLLF